MDRPVDFSLFRNPPARHRPAPFYAVNDVLDTGEVHRQVTDLIGRGFSGVFFHSRTGLVTSYLGDEWMDALQTAVRAARGAGGTCWIYDEDMWPSGNAGGMIASQSQAFRAAAMVPIFVPAGATP